MVINDLKETCTRCGGSGRMAGIRNLGIPQINIGGLCSNCGGQGYLLTELGQDLVKLLRPIVQEMIAEAMPPPEEEKKEEPEPEEE
jgi:hypothetical protein